MNDSYWLPLEHYQVMTLEGKDAQPFLHNQCTHDVMSIQPGQARYGSHCNPKGRMISNFLNAQLATTLFALRLRGNLEPIARAAFNKYLVFSKAKINEEPRLHCFALLGTGALALLETIKMNKLTTFSHQHDANCIECWANSDQYQQFTGMFKSIKKGASDLWEEKMITLGIVDINASESEQFLPQELNMDRIDAISFTKGCYTGQEVIARLHYRGKLKKQIHRGTVHVNEKIAMGSNIVDVNSGKSCGKVLRYCRSSNRMEFLAICNNESVNNHTATLEPLDANAIKDGADHTKIIWLDLPYAIP